MSTKELIRSIITHQELEEGILSKSIAVLSHRPFNMKGQEIEEIFGVILRDGLKSYMNFTNSYVLVPQDKGSADILFSVDGTKEDSLDIKFYGGAKRLQLSTLKDILQEIRNKFLNTEPRVLNFEEKEWLINLINKVHIDYNLSFVSFLNKDGSIDIHSFDFDKFNMEIFDTFKLNIVGKEKRVEIYSEISDTSYLEISAGGNPLNRGMWLNRVNGGDDMKKIYDTNFISKVFTKRIENLEFDKNKYIFEKAKRTIQLIKEQF